MNDREYLRSLGFTVGDRGRLSLEMKAALASRDGVTDSEDEPTYRSTDKFPDGRWAVERSNGLPSLLKHKTRHRNNSVYQATLTDGTVIACSYCGLCNETIIYCECEDGPQPPRYLSSDVASWSEVE